MSRVNIYTFEGEGIPGMYVDHDDYTNLETENNTLRQQRDNLAGLLRKVLATHDYHTDDGEHAADEAHAALAEVE